MNHQPSQHHGVDTHGADAHAGHGSTEAGGLAVSEHGFTFELDSTIFAVGAQDVKFRILGPNGKAVTDFTASHEKQLHFIAVRRDTADFQHVHPVMDAPGTWSVELQLTPGNWRFFADFLPSGHAAPMTLGIDASVAGHFEPQPLPAIAHSVQLGEYTVNLEGELFAGQASDLTFSVTKSGAPVSDLEPYLAAFGHLVALRVGDLGYLHVHPEGEPGDGKTPAGPEIAFMAAAPSPGFYRLFLDFQHEGVVRTAEFTLRAGATAGSSGHHADAADAHAGHDGHAGHDQHAGHGHH